LQLGISADRGSAWMDATPHRLAIANRAGWLIQIPTRVFRTPPGCNLYVRGPANSPKDGIAALEGIIETDWSEATFTMNWSRQLLEGEVSNSPDGAFETEEITTQAVEIVLNEADLDGRTVSGRIIPGEADAG
jgi:Family of unknown function (DUF6065)